MNFLTNIDLKQNQIINAAVHKLGAAPSNPVKGQIYFNTSEGINRLFYFNGSDWIGADATEATMTGTNIVDAINLSESKIDDDNLSVAVNAAITATHSHTNKAVLDAITASFTTDQETKLSHIKVTQAVDLDTMESDITANNSKVSNATHTGDVTGATALTITSKAVTNAKLADMAANTIKGRKETTSGVPQDLTAAEVRTILNIEDGANAYTHPNHTGDVTSVADGATTIGNNKVTLAKMATVATASVLGRKTAGTGNVEVLTKTDLLSLLNVADGAQPNAVTSVAGRTGAIALTSSDVSLGNVTNNAQIKKSASSTNGNIATWSGTTGDALGTGYGVETTLTGGATNIARADAVKTYVDNLLSANDAMVYKGTLGSGGTVTALPTSYSAGWAYKVITAATYAGHVCEIGDLIIAVVNRTGLGNTNADWTVVQSNLDGAVTGPSSSTNGNFPLFDGVTGKLIQNSTYSPASFAAAGHDHIGTYTRKYTTSLGASTSQVITHNLNTRDLAVTIRETGSSYSQVYTDIDFTSVNTLTVKFAVAPTAGQYTITVIG